MSPGQYAVTIRISEQHKLPKTNEKPVHVVHSETVTYTKRDATVDGPDSPTLLFGIVFTSRVLTICALSIHSMFGCTASVSMWLETGRFQHSEVFQISTIFRIRGAVPT